MATMQTEAEAFWYLPANLSAQQMQALSDFRAVLETKAALHAGQDDDITLLRFLKARSWNIDAAMLMYTNMVAWRKENKVDELYTTFSFSKLDKLNKHYAHWYHKQDKYGRPVYIERLGCIDCGKMLEEVTQEEVLTYHTWTWERLQRQLMPSVSVCTGRPVRTCTVIVDMAGLGMRSFGLAARKLLQGVTKVDQANYPEHLGTMFIINCPLVFSAIWSVVSPWLEERTRRKIFILGSDYLPTLTQLIPIENIPTMFGGKSECPDTLSCVGAWTSHEPCASSAWFPPTAPHTTPTGAKPSLHTRVPSALSVFGSSQLSEGTDACSDADGSPRVNGAPTEPALASVQVPA